MFNRLFLRLLMSLTVIVVVAYVTPQSWSIEPAQEDEYQKARTLLEEGRLDDALNIFTKLAESNPSDLKIRLGVIDTIIEQARVLKANKTPGWQDKLYKAYRDLQSIFKANTTSPEVYLSFARCYWVNDRLSKAERSLQKAFYFKPDYTEAWVFRGDMYAEEGRGKKSAYSFAEGKRDIQESFETYRAEAMGSYEKALAGAGIDAEIKAMVYYKLGDTYFELYDHKDKSREQWNKAVSIAPEGPWGKKAQERLNALK